MIFTTDQERRGFSLIELMVTLAVGSAMAGVAVSVLYLLLALERDARKGFRRRASTAQLVERFRDDVHRATDFEASEAPQREGEPRPTWELKLAEDHALQYACTGDKLRRVERARGKPVSQDTFVLPEDVEVNIGISEVAERAMLSLRIVPKDAAAKKPAVRPIRVDAVLGRDHRFRQQ